MSYTLLLLAPEDGSFESRRIDITDGEHLNYGLWRAEDERPLEVMVIGLDRATAIATATTYNRPDLFAFVFERSGGSVGVRIRLRQPGSVRERHLAREWDAASSDLLVARYLGGAS
jgi:hypothetical protein